MRAVDRGRCPISPNGAPLSFNPYLAAAIHLKTRLGRYCSFCERSIPVNLAVEHKLPKLHFPELAHVWENFLLGCGNCNSSKGAKFVADKAVMFPDTHDTFSAFEYVESGRIRLHSHLTPEQAREAAALLELVGLSREPKDIPETDYRWVDRMETWSMASQSRADLASDDTPAMRAAIVRTAVARGGFSIWMTAFAHDEVMRRELVAKFPGTRIHEMAA